MLSLKSSSCETRAVIRLFGNAEYAAGLHHEPTFTQRRFGFTQLGRNLLDGCDEDGAYGHS